MSRKGILAGDYFNLFVRREGKVVLGKGYSNLWLLTAVLTLTFLAIAFSNASLKYLAFKMDDPFINWVDIQNDYGEGDIDGLLQGLSEVNNMDEFHFVNHQVDYTYNIQVFGRQETQIQYPSCVFFESFAENPLLAKILEEQVDDQAIDFGGLSDDMVGLIVTRDLIKKLGYDETPAYIDLCKYGDHADTLGFHLYKGMAHVPVPVIAVVSRLPMNADIVSTKFFLAQFRNDYTYPFLLDNRKYTESLVYYVPGNVNVDEFKSFISHESGDSCYVADSFIPEMRSFKPGSLVSLSGYSSGLSSDYTFLLDEKIMGEYGDYGVKRVYDYDFSNYNLSRGDFISVQFKDLNKISDFESFVKENYKVRIEMSQINAKENFNAVTIMANILSWAIIVFSIICIMLFVINLLQSYFQKVKKNLGTFKAFGISNAELISVYVLIMLVTICAAVIISLAFTSVVQALFPVLGILKDGTFNYLSLWNSKTVFSIMIILVCSVVTVYSVMRRLLSATPGDLIYDRQ